MTNKNKQTGFSLIELMIVVAILGIISSIAVPSYMTYVKKSKRTEAKTELLRIAQLQESYYIQNFSYANNVSKLGYTGNSFISETGLYKIIVQGRPLPCGDTGAKPCTGFNVYAKAIPNAGQGNDEKCKEFFLRHTGAKGAAGQNDTTWDNPKTIKECWG